MWFTQGSSQERLARVGVKRTGKGGGCGVRRSRALTGPTKERLPLITHNTDLLPFDVRGWALMSFDNSIFGYGWPEMLVQKEE